MKITCKNICKSFQNNTTTMNRDVLRGISFDLESGDSLSISGPSGAGKSTLLNIISGLDEADRGDIYFDKICFSNLKTNEKTKFRLQNISLVFQSFNLLKDFNVLENIMPVSYTHLRAHETDSYLVCRLLLEKKKK